MGNRGKCACCDRSGLVLPAKGLCGTCYAAVRAGQVYYSAEQEMWLARSESVADRLGCVWQDDSALSIAVAEPEDVQDDLSLEDVAGDCEPIGDGDFVEASKFDGVPDVDTLETCLPDEVPSCSPQTHDDVNLLAGFEPYKKLTRPIGSPYITIQNTGKVRLNRDAVRKFQLRGMTHVLLFWNPDRQQMAMQLVMDDHDGMALKLTALDKHRSLCFHSGGFFKAQGVKPKSSRPFPIVELRSGLLVATIDIERAA